VNAGSWMTLVDEVARLVVAQQTTRSSDLADNKAAVRCFSGLIMNLGACRSTERPEARQDRRRWEKDRWGGPWLWY
jgi:hypothetical protein